MTTIPRFWTPCRDRRLRDLLRDGVSPAEIAEIFGATAASVQTRMSRLGVITARGVPWTVRDAIIRRHGEGWRPSRIARQVGLEQHVVETILELYVPQQQEQAA